MNTSGIAFFSKRFELDIHSDFPIYQQIVDQIKAQIASGALQPGDQLPTVRALATDLRINFNTVARAYRILDEERIISTQQGRGTYITDIPPAKPSKRMRREALDSLTSRYLNEVSRLGFAPDEIKQIIADQLKIRSESLNKGE